jgi:hypothetical protein
MEKATTTRDPKVSATIRRMKEDIKRLAADQRLLKSLRKTKHNVHPDKARLLREHFGEERGAWRLPMAIQRGREHLTALHIAYGELRGRPHKVADRWEYGFDLGLIRRKYDIPELLQILRI